MVLVQEMSGNMSLGTRLEALMILRTTAHVLSGARRDPSQDKISSLCEQELVQCSTKLQRELNLKGGNADSFMEPSKTRRWRRPRTSPVTTTNKFGSVSVQILSSLFALLSHTKNEASIWAGPVGEKFLSEFLKTLSIMLYWASTHTSPALPVLAVDLFNLAWSFHDAECSEVRYAALMAMAICVSLVPLEFILGKISSHGLRSFLDNCSNHDENAECRRLASLVVGSVSEVLDQNMIERL